MNFKKNFKAEEVLFPEKGQDDNQIKQFMTTTVIDGEEDYSSYYSWERP